MTEERIVAFEQLTNKQGFGLSSLYPFPTYSTVTHVKRSYDDAVSQVGMHVLKNVFLFCLSPAGHCGDVDEDHKISALHHLIFFYI